MPRAVLHLGLSALLIAAVGCGADEATGLAPDPTADAGVAAPDTGVRPAQDAGTAPAADAGGYPDAAAPVDQCDPVAQSGCTPPYDKCVVEGPTAGTECIAPGTDDLPLGAACDGRDCEAGLACARPAAASPDSVCVKVCNWESGEGCASLGPDYECRTRLGASAWGACGELPAVCDPYTQSPCARDEACQPFLRRTGTWEFRCRAPGPGGEGDACGPGTSSACARGLACVSDPRGAAFCRRICQVNQDCTAPAQCSGVVGEPPFMYCSE